MHAAQFRTLPGNTRTAQFTHAVILRANELIAPNLIHLLAHWLGHSLAAKQPDMYLQVFRWIDSSLAQLLS